MDKLKGIKVAILVADGFEQIELEKPRLALETAGAETFIISPEKNRVQGGIIGLRGINLQLMYR